MKRYRITNFDLDSRASFLSAEILDSWEERVRESHIANKALIRQQLVGEFGSLDFNQKECNLCEMGNAPLSILAFHNQFLGQIRSAFVIGAYYPALTGACALGERVLNHLMRELRHEFKGTPQYKRVYSKSSFDDWNLATDTLGAWDVLLQEVVNEYRKLAELRNRSLHFDPSVDAMVRPIALEAIQLLSEIIGKQFSGFGNLPWFISGIAGVSFIRKEWESKPFVKHVYLPNCALVSPFHTIEMSGDRLVVVDPQYGRGIDGSDEEFVQA
jgi:hypothetical protein